MSRVKDDFFTLPALMGLIVLATFSNLPGQPQFRPESEREALSRTSAYEEWIENEGIPIHRGQAIPNLAELPLGPWKRLGASGAFVVLDGMQGVMDTFIVEIPPGKKTNPQKHFFEENILILSGKGETEVWQGDGQNKQTVPFDQWSVFSPPLNTWHQHHNRGDEPVKFVSVTNASFLMDFFHDSEILFRIETNVPSRYNGEGYYFDREFSKDWAPYKGKHSLTLVNYIRNARTAVLSTAGQGYGDVDRHFILSNNRMGTHIESFPVGTYERAHRHGPGAAIIFLSGTGYSLYWPRELGTTPFADGKGDQVEKVAWQNGTMFVPADQWFHQHFNSGTEPARFIKLGSPFGPGGRNVVFKMVARLNTEGRSLMIRYGEEDPAVRKIFETELKRNEAPLKMPPVAELRALEKKAEETSGGMLQNVVIEP